MSLAAGRPTALDSESSRNEAEWSPDLDPDDLCELQEAKSDPSRIIFDLPRESARLGFISTICLIFNRMIGTGIFNSGAIVFTNTHSIGLSLLFWIFGGFLALAGVIVYIELGLSIPRWPIGTDGEKVSTPRSGEALNYFNYMLKKPAFLATCMFGITFIILENTAANSVSFAQNIVDAAGMRETPGNIIGIALAVNTFCCLLHASSRKWGIILNNFFGLTKLLILIFIVILGLCRIDRSVAAANYDPKTSFSFHDSPHMPYRYAEAFLYVVYPYGAFHQINYVISEVDKPRKTFPKGAWWGVMIVAIMYTAVQMIFAAIIPKADLFVSGNPGGMDVGVEFFQLALATVTTKKTAKIVFLIIKAYSAFGNIIVVTFTTARVKQEIAKEGILPYSLFFAQSYHFDLGWLWRKEPIKVDVNAVYAEKTPIATLALHWTFTTIMVLGPILAIKTPGGFSGSAAQSLLAGIFAYDIDVVCFTCIAIGLLCLRFTPRVRWAQKSEFKSPIISVGAAIVLLVACLLPLIFVWVPDPRFPFVTKTNHLVRWFSSQTAGIGLLSFSFFYWVCFRLYILIRSAREGKTLYVRREPKFKHDSGGLTQILEIITLDWRREVGIRLDEIVETDDGLKSVSALHASTGSPVFPTYAPMRNRPSPGFGRDSVFERFSFVKKPEIHELPAAEGHD